MKDAFGNETFVGDLVIYITPRHWAHEPVRLAAGTVKKVTRTGVMIDDLLTARKPSLFTRVNGANYG